MRRDQRSDHDSRERVRLNTAGVTVYAIGDGIYIDDGLSDIRIDGGGSLTGGGGLKIGKDHNIKVEALTLQGESDLGGSMAGIQIGMGTGVNGIEADSGAIHNVTDRPA